MKRVESELGSVDILVNNAGTVSLSGGVMNEKAEDWDGVIETQLNSVFLLSKLGAGSMIRNKRGKIINIGSMYSYFGSGLIPSYSAAKGAIVQLTKSMAIEFAPHNIQVNAIAPGWIETEMTAPVRTEPSEGKWNDEIDCREPPRADAGQPEEVAGTAVFPASQASDFVTGHSADSRGRRLRDPIARCSLPRKSPIQLCNEKGRTFNRRGLWILDWIFSRTG